MAKGFDIKSLGFNHRGDYTCTARMLGKYNWNKYRIEMYA